MNNYRLGKSLIFTIIITAQVFFSGQAFSELDANSTKVMAVVNDQIISSVDLGERIKLVMVATGIADTQENRAKLAPQILHQLVDEKLQQQDAAKNSIVIGDAQLDDTIARIEKQNNREPGSLVGFFESKGASKSSFLAQIRSQAAWSEIVLRRIRPNIRVSEQEISLYAKHKSLSGNASKEVMIATIQLPVDSPANEPAVHKAASKLADEIHSGASFEAVAGQFSSGVGGPRATEPFWVDISQLDPAINAVLSKVNKGGVTEPVKTDSGYQIVKLLDVRQKAENEGGNSQDVAPKPRTEFTFREIVISAKSNAQKPSSARLQEIAKNLSALPAKCTAKAISAGNDAGNIDLKVSFIRRLSENLSDEVRNILLNTVVGNASRPLVTANDVRLFVLCERTTLPPEKPSASVVSAADEAARQAIYEEKLELGAQKYLRNLRREAFIEVHGL